MPPPALYRLRIVRLYHRTRVQRVGAVVNKSGRPAHATRRVQRRSSAQRVRLEFYYGRHRQAAAATTATTALGDATGSTAVAPREHAPMHPVYASRR